MACARQSLWKAFFCIYDYFSVPTIVQLPHALKQQLLPFCNNYDSNAMLCWKDPAMIYCFYQDIPWALLTSSCLFFLNEHLPPSFLSNSPLSLIPILISGNSVVLAWSSLSQLTPLPKVVDGMLQTPFLCQEPSAFHKQDPPTPCANVPACDAQERGHDFLFIYIQKHYTDFYRTVLVVQFCSITNAF